MALKDWKKVSKGRWKNNEGETIFIFQYHKISKKEIGYGFSKKWFVMKDIGFENRKAQLGYFKTESQALKFAKEYMRKH